MPPPTWKRQHHPRQAQRSYDKAVDPQYIRTDIAGTVASFKVREGDVVNAGQEVAIIRDDTTLLLELEFPAADAANFSVGQSAEVLLDGTFEALTGTITAVTGTDALSTRQPAGPHRHHRGSNAGSLTTAQAATATINGVSSIASANFQYQAERTLTALAQRYRHRHQCAGGRQRQQGRHHPPLTGKELTESIQSASETLRSAELSMQNMQEAWPTTPSPRPSAAPSSRKMPRWAMP